MKIVIASVLILLCWSCSEKLPKKKAISYYYLSSIPGRSQHSKDTIPYKRQEEPDTTYELLRGESFEYKGKAHWIQMYTNEDNVPVDGGSLVYTLDSLGIMYRRSTTWPGFTRLSSDNDSINDLISTAFGYILMKDMSYGRQHVVFVPPVIKEDE